MKCLFRRNLRIWEVKDCVWTLEAAASCLEWLGGVGGLAGKAGGRTKKNIEINRYVILDYDLLLSKTATEFLTHAESTHLYTRYTHCTECALCMYLHRQWRTNILYGLAMSIGEK